MSRERINAIDEGRQKVIEQQEIKEMFTRTIELLKVKGVEKKGFLSICRYQVFRHIDKSSEPGVQIEIKAGNDLNKAQEIEFSIEGKKEPFCLSKWGTEGRELFRVERLDTKGRYLEANRDETRSYLDAIKQVVVQALPH